MPKISVRWLLIFLSIALLGLLLRYLASSNNTFMNTGVPVYISMMRQAMANNYAALNFSALLGYRHSFDLEYPIFTYLVVPKLNALSGFPAHNPGPEYLLLTYMGILPSWLSGGAISIIHGMYLMQIMFSLLGMCTAYLLTKKITGNAKWGLFGMLLYAMQPFAIADNAFKAWEGVGFVPVLLALSVLILLYGLEEKGKYKKYSLIAASLIPVLFAHYLWSGGVFALVSYLFVLVAIYAFKRTKNLAVTSVLVAALISIGWLAYGHTTMGTVQPSVANLVALLTQTGTVSVVRNLFYAMYLYGAFPSNLSYIIFMACGCIFALSLVAMCLANFGAGPHEESENVFFVAALALLMAGIPFTLYGQGWSALITVPIAAIAGSSIDSLNRRMKKKKTKNRDYLSMPTFVPAVCIAVNIVFVALMLATTLPQAPLTLQYRGTMLWIRNNTPANSTFLTWGQDGDAIEGWANRTSYTDSYSFDNNKQAVYDFSRFLFAKPGNLSYIGEIRPDYLLVRRYWYAENGEWKTLEEEGNLPIDYLISNVTNLQLFSEKPETITMGNISMQLVYDAPNGTNESIIYSIKYSK